MTTIRFKKNRALFTGVVLLITAALLGPGIFVHFPRTCIPYVDPQHQTGKRRSLTSSISSSATNTADGDDVHNTNNSSLQLNQLQHTPVRADSDDGEKDFSTSEFLLPKIVILSGEQCNNPNPQSKCRVLGGISYHNRREYVAHHLGQYDLRDNFTDYFDQIATKYPKGDVTPAWAKIKILKDELNRRLDKAQEGDTREHDWIFWLDTDALLVEMDIQLERFIDNRVSLIITKDHHGLNAGVFFLKVNEWSRQFMNYIDQQIGPDFTEQDWMASTLKKKMILEPAASNTNTSPQVGGTEGDVLKKALVSWDESREEDQVKYLPQCSFNSYWQMKGLYQMYRPGDFAIHWAGHNYDLEGFHDWQMRRYFKLPTFSLSN